MKQEEVLKLFEETGALLNGHFELRSGLHSNRFFQCAHLLQYPRVSGQLCEALVEKMKAELAELEVDTVIAPAMGGITIGHEVARSLGVRFIFVEKEDIVVLGDLSCLSTVSVAQTAIFIGMAQKLRFLPVHLGLLPSECVMCELTFWVCPLFSGY